MCADLASINSEYEGMHKQVCEALLSKDMDDLPEKVRQFEITPHEYHVLQALEWLLRNEPDPFVDYQMDPPEPIGVVAIVPKSFEEYRPMRAEDHCVLRWALLLHDITKGRDLPEPHSEESAKVADRLLQKLDPLSKDDMKCAVWLVQNHDVLGNIYTGERSPSFLLDITTDGQERTPEQLLMLLQAVTLCDVRGLKGGAYLTEQKAEFWLSLSDAKSIQQRQAALFDWRLERWTGNLAGSSNEEKKEAVHTALRENEAVWCLVKRAFGERITHIVYGIYLFVALDGCQLETLMKLIALAADCMPDGDLRLIFRPGYKPASAGGDRDSAPKVLAAYQEQLRGDSMRMGVDASLHSGGEVLSTEKGDTLYCFGE